MIKVRISATIDNEYNSRAVFGGDDEWPLVPDGVGLHDLPIETAKAVLRDAEFQIDPNGPFAEISEPGELGIKNAYRALAKQIRYSLIAAGEKL